VDAANGISGAYFDQLFCHAEFSITI